MLDLVLRNATIVTPTGLVNGDLGILDGKIYKIGKVTEKFAREKDCSGLFILPGVIDMHVHFRDPGFPAKEDFESGSAAAACGGVTTVFDMPNTNPPTLTVKALEEKRQMAAAKSHVNFGLYMGLAQDNLEEIKQARGIAGVKAFMGSTTGNLLVEDMKIYEKLFELGKLVIVHAEDEHIIRENTKKYAGSEDVSVHSLIRSPKAAYQAVKTILHLAKKHNARVHVTHLSTELEVEELRKFKNEKVSADCTTHHLYLTESAYAERGNFVKVNPPLRTNDDRQALWKGLKEGILQAVTTDHAPHTRAEKEQPYSLAPSGVPGVETLLPLLLESVSHGELTLRDVAQFTSTNPAALLRIKGKGRIEAGYDADLAIVDMSKEMAVGQNGYKTKCGWSPYSGWRLKGWPVMTIIGGHIVCENGELDMGFKGREVVFA